MVASLFLDVVLANVYIVLMSTIANSAAAGDAVRLGVDFQQPSYTAETVLRTVSTDDTSLLTPRHSAPSPTDSPFLSLYNKQ